MIHVSQALSDTSDSLLGRIYWCTVDTIIQNHIVCRSELPDISCAEYSVQVITPVPKDLLALSDTLYPPSWNGRFGGIIAVWHPGTLALRAPLHASGNGYRGGVSMFPTFDTTGNGTSHTGVGEGEVCFSTRQHRGGWPGSAPNAGGGGGASTRLGGSGGLTTNAYNAPMPLARGGVPISNTTEACVFGGGGGAGHRNDVGRSQGGNGGGIVAIYCDTLYVDSSATIDVSGGSGMLSELDGAGGGGGGGCISIHGKLIGTSVSLSARGGNGGSTMGSLFAYGPGGGGAGGSSVLSEPPSGSLSMVAVGGLAGEATSRTDTRISARNASAGDSGRMMIAPSQRVLATSSSLGVLLTCQDTIVEMDSTTIVSVRGAATCIWRDRDVSVLSPNGSRIQTPPIREPRWFVVTITTPKGCTVVDSINVRPKLEANTLTVEADMLRAAPGDTIDLFMRFTSASSLNAPLTGVAYISTRASIAQPLERYAFDSVRVQARIPFTLSSGATSTFRRTKYAITLGDSMWCTVAIDSVVLTSSPMTVRRRNGRITLDSICLEGNKPRLFDPSTRAFSLRGRTIIARADEMWVVDPIGRRISVNSTRKGQELHVTLPEELHGIIHIVTISDGYPHHRAMLIDE